MKLDSLGALFANAWKLYKTRLSVALKIVIIPTVVVGLGDLLILEGGGRGALLGGVLNFIGIIIAVVALLAVIAAIGKGADVNSAFATGFKLFWPAIWIMILNGLTLLGGFTLLVIPGIFLAVAFTFVNYVFVLEGKHGIAALMTSKAYVKGYWWAVFGRTILLVLIFVVVMLFVRVPAAILFGNIFGGIIYAILVLFMVPFSICYIYTVYENLRRLKPNAAEEAGKTSSAFLKVCMAVGIVAIIAIALTVGVAAKYGAFRYDNYNNDNYGGYPTGAAAEIYPSSGPVGSMVTITFPTAVLDATDTVLMNGLVAARNVLSSNDGKTLSFTMPATLAPNCDPGMMCPQFMLHVTPSIYSVSVAPASASAAALPISAGDFTVITSTY